MKLTYETISFNDIEILREPCNALMDFQKSKATITPERFDVMNFDTRLLPSIEKAVHNYIVVVKDEEKVVGYVYTNVSQKEVYVSDFATFFDLSSVKADLVGCLSQFYIDEGYRKYGIGSKLFRMSMEWLDQFKEVEDHFIFVSNGNDHALEFYQQKGFKVSHDILDGFITVLRK
ncbi:ribosomal protein S18 acetylase RimI-like enzyme [Bacillus tianshenii]|uniref:Ribosomal protein S18 acetylase RimI-like enzyme n=1 Tax=Sutcliffiella tianshenii TaxID=1463404 RepID=A0ABS2P3F7_9BACI|nr:GNAT family N-acetyltransferase [Bacillus tianshenii]MBM7621152.1 ribosomal protein S18 acetylase RimI-like enzyme [Bacillus tianshenii]